jgi:hypothetical protein
MEDHTATVVEDLGIMLVFGGIPFHDEAYSLNLSSMEWSRIDNVQYERDSHSADLIAGSIYLFGGYYRGCKNDVQLYDIHNSTLQRVDTTGNPPSERSCHGSAVIKEHLYVFGGTGSQATNNDQNLYSLNTKSKHWVTIPNTTDSFPQPRSYISMFSFDDKLYLFGGETNKDD